MRVLHAERIEDLRAQIDIERHPRRALDDAAQDVRAVAVNEGFARLSNRRQRPEPRHRSADRLVLVRRVPAISCCRTQAFRFVQCGDVRLRAIRIAGRMGQQVVDRDRSFDRHELGAAVLLDRDLRFRELGNESAHGLVEIDLAFLDELQDRRARQCFGLRSDAEDRVLRHAPLGFLVAPADRAFIHGLAVLKDERHGTRDTSFVDILLE